MTYFAYTMILIQYLLRLISDKYFPLKPDPVGEPDVYLGAKLKLMQLENDIWAWGLSPSKYVQEAIQNCKNYVEENLPKFYKLMRLAPNPLPMNNRPELHTSPELRPKHESYDQSLMGIYRWMIELGTVDICTELSMYHHIWHSHVGDT